MLLFSPTFVLISDSLEAPVAIAEIIALYSDGSRTSCLRRFSGSSKRAEDEFKNAHGNIHLKKILRGSTGNPVNQGTVRWRKISEIAACFKKVKG